MLINNIYILSEMLTSTYYINVAYFVCCFHSRFLCFDVCQNVEDHNFVDCLDRCKALQSVLATRRYDDVGSPCTDEGCDPTGMLYVVAYCLGPVYNYNFRHVLFCLGL